MVSRLDAHGLGGALPLVVGTLGHNLWTEVAPPLDNRSLPWHHGCMVSYLTNTPIGQQGDGDLPLFLQVAQRISDDIVDGTLAEGDQVPSINEFAAFWRINPATALKGISQLVTDGVLYKQRGIGTFVADGARAQLLKQRKAEFADRYLQPLIAEAARLGISTAELADLIRKEES